MVVSGLQGEVEDTGGREGMEAEEAEEEAAGGSRRRLVADLIPDTQRRNKGVFPENDVFIERVNAPGGTKEVENGS